jgi:6-pyruvoyl-tetrahydropterin synthase
MEQKHVHGHLYRVKIAASNGTIEYGDWFDSETALRSAMKEVARHIGKRYYCEAKLIHCAQCEADESPRVIAAL